MWAPHVITTHTLQPSLAYMSFMHLILPFGQPFCHLAKRLDKSKAFRTFVVHALQRLSKHYKKRERESGSSLLTHTPPKAREGRKSKRRKGREERKKRAKEEEKKERRRGNAPAEREEEGKEKIFQQPKAISITFSFR
jgi:hypothetical protein